eukprot:scaffold585_cov311-Prasinococcus_capsulatus_cf.AAC.10
MSTKESRPCAREVDASTSAAFHRDAMFKPVRSTPKLSSIVVPVTARSLGMLARSNWNPVAH